MNPYSCLGDVGWWRSRSPVRLRGAPDLFQVQLWGTPSSIISIGTSFFCNKNLISIFCALSNNIFITPNGWYLIDIGGRSGVDTFPPPRQMSTLGHRNSIFFIGTSKSRYRNLILIFCPLSNDIFCVANGLGCMEIQGAVCTPFLSLFRLLDVNNSTNVIETCNFFYRNLISN